MQALDRPSTHIAGIRSAWNWFRLVSATAAAVMSGAAIVALIAGIFFVNVWLHFRHGS